MCVARSVGKVIRLFYRNQQWQNSREDDQFLQKVEKPVTLLFEIATFLDLTGLEIGVK